MLAPRDLATSFGSNTYLAPTQTAPLDIHPQLTNGPLDIQPQETNGLIDKQPPQINSSQSQTAPTEKRPPHIQLTKKNLDGL